MKIGSENIIIPLEDPVGYTLDWRRRAARVLTTTPQICPPEIASDAFLKVCRRHFQLVDHGFYPVDKEEYDCIQRVLNWHDKDKSEFRRILEAFLLTAAPFEVIGADIGISVNDVRMYERLCFNVRDDRGCMALGDVQRLMIGRQDLTDEQGLKLTAIIGGYEVLCGFIGIQMPHWKEKPELKIQDKILQAGLAIQYHNLILGKCAQKDLLAIEANDIKRQQVLAQIKQPDEEKTERIDPIGLRLLKMMAPKMIEIKLTEEEKKKQNEALKNKLQIEAKINNTQIVDHGVKAAISILNDGISKHLSCV